MKRNTPTRKNTNALYKGATKADLIELVEGIDKARRDTQEKLTIVGKDYLKLQEQNRKLEEQRDEWEHLAESVISGVRETLNEDPKLYHVAHNTYYALWYWVEWGGKVNKSLKKETK